LYDEEIEVIREGGLKDVWVLEKSKVEEEGFKFSGECSECGGEVWVRNCVSGEFDVEF
jgi:hypothetical protein